MSGKKANDNPGLCPVKGQKTGLCSWTGVRNQFSSMFPSTTDTAPHYQMLVIPLALYISFNVLPRDPEWRLRTNKLLNRTVSCKLVGDIVVSYPITSRDPISPTTCRVEISFNAFWHFRTNGEVVSAVWRAFRAAFSGGEDDHAPPLVPRLRMSGAVPLFQQYALTGQLYFCSINFSLGLSLAAQEAEEMTGEHSCRAQYRGIIVLFLTFRNRRCL